MEPRAIAEDFRASGAPGGGGAGEDSPVDSRTYGVIIPVCNEEESLGMVLDELAELGSGVGATLVPVVGLNGTSDRSPEIARERGAVVGETGIRGYGHGCMAAIERLHAGGMEVDAYIFVSGDGADRPSDILKVIESFEAGGLDMVIGNRTLRVSNWKYQGSRRAFPNVTLAAVATLLTGRLFFDLGPLRLICRDLFDRIVPSEISWGWTIEAQIVAARLGAEIGNVNVEERPRLAGAQKVSGVNWKRSLGIELAILAAGWRARWRPL